MKKIFIVILTTLFFILPAKALALDLQETQQFRALDNYVVALAERSDSTATSEEKQTYRERLTMRRDNALERLGNLREVRVIAAKRTYKKQKGALLSRLEDKLRRQQDQARGNWRGAMSQAKSSYRSRLADLNSRYGSEIKSLKKKISALRKKMKNTKDPSERVDIGNEINSLQGALRPLEESLKSGQAKAQNSYKQDVARLGVKLKQDLARARGSFSKSWSQGKQNLSAALNKNLTTIGKTVSRERGDVLSLYREGLDIINGMPAPTAKKKAKKAHRKGQGR